MDTLSFLQTTLPGAGIYFLAVFKNGHRFPMHKAYSDLETMADAIDGYAKATSVQAYHACASYLKPGIEVEGGTEDKPKLKYRIPENWGRAKSFWVDLDCGQEKFDKGAGYLTKKDAATAIFKFAQAISWPKPLLVDSGNGLHAYWPLTKDIAPSKWQAVAKVLKAALAHAGVIADPTRTADFSSILRPANSTNRKNGDAKPVVVKSPGTPEDPATLADALLKYTQANHVKLIKDAPRREVYNDLNSDLTAHLPQYPNLPVDANRVADQCLQVGAMRDSEGDVPYEVWRGVVGLLTHCEDGEAMAEAWSARRDETGHSQTDWQTRYSTWNAGPTTCEFFKKCHAGGCTGCAMDGKIKTPLVLGRIIPINEEVTETVVDDDGEEQEVVAPALPTGYTWDSGFLARVIPNKEGIHTPHPFSNQLFYPTTRIRTEDGTYRIGIRLHMPNKKVRDFDMSAEAMASQTDMLRALARYELMHSNHKDAGSHMAAYLRDQLEALKRRTDEVNTLTSFGWKDNDTTFLLGDRLVQKDGSVRKVLVSSGAGKWASALPAPRGSVAKYAEALNFMYNRPGNTHWQYAVCSGWGSILTPFCEELYKGLILALTGGDTGKGKTTVCYAAMYAFGDAEKMTLKSKDGFTNNALWAFLGAYNNVPVLVDELSNMDAPTFSDTAYGVSRGEEKVRMTSRGGNVMFANNFTWGLSPYVTGNRDFHGLLATTQGNSQAEAVRLIQINVDRYPMVPLHPDRRTEAEMVQNAVDTMKENCGGAGEAMVKYVLMNRKTVAAEVREMMGRLVDHLPETKYRFYRNHAACTLVMARIAKELGIIEFDLDEMFEFSVRMLSELADTVRNTNTMSIDEAFGRMMATLSSRILVTVEFRDKRHKDGPETPRNRIHGDVAGRYVLGSPTRKDCAGQIMLNQKEVRDWCMKNRTDFNALMDHLDSEGALIKRADKITLTRGTDVPAVQARCIVVDSYKIDKDALTLVQPVVQAVPAGQNVVGVV